MICHVVLIRLREDAEEGAAKALLERARELLEPIPGVSNLRLGKGLGKKDEKSYPYALVMEFEDEKALEGYQVHPDHEKFVREVVGPIQDRKQVFDYWC
jgi:Stress responsive A/B Barrel Domain